MKAVIVCLIFIISPNVKSNQAITIGFIAGFTGTDPNTSNELFKATEIFYRLNPKAKRRVKFRKIDNKGQVSETYLQVAKAMDEGIKFFVGIANSDEAIAAAKIIQERGGLFITPFATNVKVTANKNRIFRVCYSDEQQGKVLAEFVKQRFKQKKLAVLTNISSSYSVGLTNVFTSYFTEKLQRATYSDVASELDVIKQKMLEFKPNVIFLPDHITRASIIVKMITKVLPGVVFVGGDGFGGQKVFLSMMAQEKDVKLYYSTHWIESLTNDTNKRFVETYRKLFPADAPTSGAALTFDAIQMLYNALLSVKNSDAVMIYKYLQGSVFSSTTGPLKFTDINDNSPTKSIVIMHYQSGNYKQVSNE